jgi:outer membrane protein OmpA-like peptidoglycan-associated protein
MTMRIFTLLLLLLPAVLGAQFKKGYRMLRKERLPEATAAFAKDTAHAKTHKKALALFGMGKVRANENAKNRDLQQAYLNNDRASQLFPELNARKQKRAAKLGMDAAGIETNRKSIANARLKEMAAEPNGDDLESFLLWPRLPEQSVEGVWPIVERLKFEGANQGLFEAHIRANAPEKNAERVLLGIFRHFAAEKMWDSVAVAADRFRPDFPNKSEWLRNVSAIASAPDQNVSVQNLGPTVNSDMYEYLPVLTIDDKQLYFCALNRPDNVGYEDIFVSNWNNGQWQRATLVSELSKRESNEAPLSISADGTQLLIFREGRLFNCRKTEKGWGTPEDIEVINKNFKWVGDARTSANGQVLVFTGSTSATDPYSTCGIYISLLDANGNWQPPFAVDALNTDSTDRSPYLHPDMQTLYFSSSGRNGLNDMDVYVTTRLDDTWKKWSTPKNLGKEFNTFNGDWGYVISTDGTKAYFASAKEGLYDLYVADLPENLRPKAVATIRGRILDPKGQPIAGRVFLVDTDNNQIVGKVNTDPSTTTFMTTVPNGSRYKIYADVDGFLSQEYFIDLKTERMARSINQDIELRPKTPPVPAPKVVYFDHDRSLARQEAQAEIQSAAKILLEGAFTMELSGHTDNVGTDAYNDALSLRRVNSVADALVRLGVKKEGLTAKGLGEKNPAVDNKTKENRAKNRRVELIFKVKQ